MNSAQQNILNCMKLDYPSIFASGELQRMSFQNEDGTYASPAIISRRLRNLESMSLIAVKYDGAKKHAFYRYLQKHERDNYIPTSKREHEYSNECWKDPSIVQQNKYKIEMRLNEARGLMEELKIMV